MFTVLSFSFRYFVDNIQKNTNLMVKMMKKYKIVDIENKW